LTTAAGTRRRSWPSAAQRSSLPLTTHHSLLAIRHSL